MDAQQEFQRLKQAFKKREQKRQNIYIANVVDITPRENSGYIVVRLKDGTQAYAHVWMTEAIEVNEVVFIIPITQESWNWYVVVGINSTKEPVNTPYVQPKNSLTSLPSHAFSSHEGKLDWSYIDTGTNKLNLVSQVQGVLPVANQEPQVKVQTVILNTSNLIPNQDSGINTYVLNTNVAYVKKISVVPSDSLAKYKISLYEPNDSLQYETAILTGPFTDFGGFFLVDYSGQRILKWKIENVGTVNSSFLLYLYIVNFYSSIIVSEITASFNSTAVILEQSISYDIISDSIIE